MSAHREIIDDLLARASWLREKGFKRSVNVALVNAGMDVEEVAEILSRIPVVPDLYGYTPEGHIVVIEVEDTSRMSPNKIAAYVSLWWALDAVEIVMELWQVDRFAGVKVWGLEEYLRRA